MSDIAEGIGAAVEGSLVGQAVEPEHGGKGTPSGDEGTCLNCGANLNGGAYCHNCGQKSHVHRTLSAILHDLIHGVLHLDGKFWLTLPLLVFKPGKLTRRYIEGERAKFVSPMAMFLFSIFAMFAVFQIVGISAPTDLEGDARAQFEDLLDTELQAVEAQLAPIEEELATPNLDEPRRADLEAERDTLLADRALLEARGQNVSSMLASGSGEIIDNLQSSGAEEIAASRARLATLPEGSPEHTELSEQIAAAEAGLQQLEGIAEGSNRFISQGVDGSIEFKSSGVDFIDNLVGKWNDNPSLMIYKMQANGYKFSWLLIPLSIPFVWLIFAWKRRFKAYDHAIFVTYSLSFMSLLFIALSLIASLPSGSGIGWAFLIFSIAAPLHVYKHLKHTYELNRFSTIWRLMALFVFILLVITLFLQALLLLGAF